MDRIKFTRSTFTKLSDTQYRNYVWRVFDYTIDIANTFGRIDTKNIYNLQFLSSIVLLRLRFSYFKI